MKAATPSSSARLRTIRAASNWNVLGTRLFIGQALAARAATAASIRSEPRCSSGLGQAIRPGQRSSTEIVRSVVQRFQEGRGSTRAAIEELDALVDPLAEAVERADLERLASCVAEVGQLQQRLADEVFSDDARAIVSALRMQRITGIKMLGGGGPGCCLLVIAPPAEVGAALKHARLPCAVLQPAFDFSGAAIITERETSHAPH
jgi:hypothetical protein